MEEKVLDVPNEESGSRVVRVFQDTKGACTGGRRKEGGNWTRLRSGKDQHPSNAAPDDSSSKMVLGMEGRGEKSKETFMKVQKDRGKKEKNLCISEFEGRTPERGVLGKKKKNEREQSLE